jgi:hypothetical protein
MVKILGRSLFEAKPIVERSLGADHITIKEANKSSMATSYTWTDRIPHPENMGNYERWSKDAEASIALEVLTNIIAGVGFYTEMPEEDTPKKPDKSKTEPKHPALLKIDEFAEQTNLDEKLSQITWNLLAKGFCPAEVIDGYRLKVLPPETFYMYRDQSGTLSKYTQERSLGDILTTWQGTEMENVLVFINEETPSRPYGLSLLDPIGNLLDGRAQLNTDVMKGVHRWANPIPIMETSKSKANSTELKQSLTDRDVDEWVLIYDVQKDEVRWNPLTVTPAKDFISFTDLIYTQICEGLHAPLLLYLKNATEASATVMMESVDRFVSGKQRYIKRRVEHSLFEPLVGLPTPRLMWGKPQTGLEKVTMSELASLVNSPALANNQKQELLKMYGVQLPEPDWATGPPLPTAQPFGGKPAFGADKPKPEAPVELLIEKLNDLGTGLDIIAVNFDEGKLKVTEACSMAERTIKAHMMRAYPNGWEAKTQEAFTKFVSERIVKHSAKPSYRITTD